MKRIRLRHGALLLAFSLVSTSQADVPVTFNLAVDPTGVALQLDVVSEDPLEALGSPTFVGASDHDVRSATLSSGVHRFVVYSSTGQPIASEGEINVVFAPSLSATSGSISISNVTASNASGVVVAADPNALPNLTGVAQDYRSWEAGTEWQLTEAAYDLDGALKSVALLAGEQQLASSSASPFSITWTPTQAGTVALTLVASDDHDQQRSLELGTFRIYSLSEIGSFSSFADVHFGASAAPESAFDADPFKRGFSNGLAYLLGINPHAPDFSRLPLSRLVRTDAGLDLLVSFQRRSQLADVSWSALASTDLEDFVAISASMTSETDDGDGSHTVELRLPLDESSDPPTFVKLEVTPSP